MKLIIKNTVIAILLVSLLMMGTLSASAASIPIGEFTGTVSWSGTTPGNLNAMAATNFTSKTTNTYTITTTLNVLSKSGIRISTTVEEVDVTLAAGKSCLSTADKTMPIGSYRFQSISTVKIKGSATTYYAYDTKQSY